MTQTASPSVADTLRNNGAAALGAVLASERHGHKLYAEFATPAAAIAAARHLHEQGGIAVSRTRLITAQSVDDHRFDIALEPEPRRIGAILGWSHLALGIVGAVVGIALIELAAARDWLPPITLGEPWLLPLVGLFFGATAGLLLAGALSLKPHRGAIAAWLADAVHHQGHAFLVVHADDAETRSRARALLGERPLNVLP
ncbi:MAG: hypothetical protein RLW61_16085 [Gammaproteobacteria bacterium]|uniref:hypothetical protein n=1 Tax=Oceanibaculum nanhaiense TaxID=1909734 RepID=UPI0032EB1F66